MTDKRLGKTPQHSGLPTKIELWIAPEHQHRANRDGGPAKCITATAAGSIAARVNDRCCSGIPKCSVLTRCLPPSLWRFAPFFDFEGQSSQAPDQILEDLSSWSTKARDTIVGTSGHAAPDSLRSLLSESSDASELALIRRSLRISLHRARRILSRKLAGLMVWPIHSDKRARHRSSRSSSVWSKPLTRFCKSVCCT